MKKLISTAMQKVCAAFNVFAGDPEDRERKAVRSTIIQSTKEAAEGQCSFSHYTEDCKVIAESFAVDLDLVKAGTGGEHPYEAALFIYKTENGGKSPSAAEAADLKAVAEDKDFIAEYRKRCELIRKQVKKAARLALETFEFRYVTVEGDTATACTVSKVYDFNEEDIESDKIVTEVTIYKLRKTGGGWKIYEEISIENPATSDEQG